MDRFARLRFKFKRFGEQELAHLIRRFNGVAVRGRLEQDSFRKTLGVLGMEVFSFLSGRMFEVMDTNHDSFVTLDEYLSYLDVMVHGNQAEKQLQSFRILAVSNTERVSFEDWEFVIMQLQLMFSSISGQRWVTPHAEIKKVFEYLDQQQRGYFTFADYERVLVEHPDLLSFLDITNSNLTGQLEQEMRKKSADDKSLQQDRLLLTTYYDVLQLLESFQRNLDELVDLLLAHTPAQHKAQDMRSKLERAMRTILQPASGPQPGVKVGAQAETLFSDEDGPDLNDREEQKSAKRRAAPHRSS